MVTLCFHDPQLKDLPEYCLGLLVNPVKLEEGGINRRDLKSRSFVGDSPKVPGVFEKWLEQHLENMLSNINTVYQWR